MTTQQEPRIVAPGKPKIGARPQASPEPEPSGGGGKGGKGGGKSRLLAIVIGVLLVVILAGAYWFLMGPGTGSEETATDDHATEEVVEEEAESGGVQVIESISINLANGHYLRLGLGLDVEASAAAHGDLGEAIALDAAIALFSGQTVEDLEDVEYREELKDHLAEELKELYHGEVIGVYYTDFVTQ